MPGPWFIVTGGNRGLGLEMARKLLESEKHVIITVRDEKRGKGVASILGKQAGAPERVQALQLDVEDSASLDQFIKTINDSYKGQIFALINNAAVNPSGWDDKIYRNAKLINLDGPVKLSVGIAPAIQKGGRIVNVTSEFGAFSSLNKSYADAITSASTLEELQAIGFLSEEPASKIGNPAYSVSKAQLNKATQIMAKMTEFKDIAVTAADPGWCKTDMGGQKAPRSPLEGRDSILATLDLPEGATGRVYLDGKESHW